MNRQTSLKTRFVLATLLASLLTVQIVSPLFAAHNRFRQGATKPITKIVKKR